MSAQTRDLRAHRLTPELLLPALTDAAAWSKTQDMMHRVKGSAASFNSTESAALVLRLNAALAAPVPPGGSDEERRLVVESLVDAVARHRAVLVALT